AGAAVLEEQLGDRGVERRRASLVLGGLRLLQVLLRDGLPVALEQRQLGRRLLRRPMLRIGLERLPNGGQARLAAQQLVRKQAALLVQQVCAPRRLLDPAELEIDELQAKLEVT